MRLHPCFTAIQQLAGNSGARHCCVQTTAPRRAIRRVNIHIDMKCAKPLSDVTFGPHEMLTTRSWLFTAGLPFRDRVNPGGMTRVERGHLAPDPLGPRMPARCSVSSTAPPRGSTANWSPNFAFENQQRFPRVSRSAQRYRRKHEFAQWPAFWTRALGTLVPVGYIGIGRTARECAAVWSSQGLPVMREIP